MFTGIIEAIGQIRDVEMHGADRRITIAAPPAFVEGAAIGDSICTSGVCLTAVELGGDAFVADVSVETLDMTTAALWEPGRGVNLEKSLTLSKPLGGHLVVGHVDGIGTLVECREDARSWRLAFDVPEALSRYIAPKGSICIDGVSLTVNDIAGNRFGVNIVPHTWTHTTFGQTGVGDAVNIEVDLMARYAERLLRADAAE